MVSHDQRRLAQLVGRAAQPADRLIRLEQELRRDASHGKDDLWLDEFDLALEVTAALRRFVGLRVAIVRRPALEDVGDKHLVASLAHGPQHFIEQLARATHKRFAAAILFSTRRLADDHQPRVRIADADSSGRTISGHGADVYIIVASAKAYVAAMNRMISRAGGARVEATETNDIRSDWDALRMGGNGF